MPWAWRWPRQLLAAEFNRPGFPVVDHRTWVFLGDGCLMEGISHEVCSLAGTLGLGKLICLYDDNGISIDGHVTNWFTDDTSARFRAYGWHVVAGVDGHDPAAVSKAIEAATAETSRPSLICCKTIIGWGAPNKQGTEKVHGEALGPEEAAAARKFLGWTAPPFEVPEAIRAGWDAHDQGARLEKQWRDLFAAYAADYPELAAEFSRRMAGELPKAWPAQAEIAIAKVAADTSAKATRKSSEDALNAFVPGAAGTVRRVRRPDRLQPDAHQGRGHHRTRPRRRQLHLLGRPGVRHVGGDERHGVARGLHSLRRHLPHVLGLFAERAAHGRPDGGPRDLRLHPRFDRPR